MSLFFGQRRSVDSSLIPSRSGRRRTPRKRSELAHSAVWGCTRLRADIISTLPIDVFRKVPGAQVEVPKPPVLKNPGGESLHITEWMYSTQVDLDSCGNTFGLITEIDGAGLPRRIDLVPREEVTVRSRGGEIEYLVSGKKVDTARVWHERQYTSSGVAVGLSPVMYAAMTLEQYGSAQEFATAWFAGGAVPTGMLKYGEAKVPDSASEAMKARYRLAIENGDVLVVGKDWEYKVIDAQSAQASFIETMRVTDIDICRFFGVPADLIDAAVPGSSITYANITQRNLQFLVQNLNAPIVRREVNLSRMLADPRFVKLNTDALLRMDPETVARMLGQQVKDRLVAPSEARDLMNRQPFTPEQIAEFKELFPVQYPSNDAQRQFADTIGGQA
jgi:HK97 family phage portal protein